MENLKSFADPFSSITQHSNLNCYSNLCNEISPFDSEEFEIDWTCFDPISFGIPSLDPNPLPVRPVEMRPFDPTGNAVFETSSPHPSPSRNQVIKIEDDSSRLTPYVVAMSSRPPPSPPRNQTMNIENGFSPTSFVTPCRDPEPTLERRVEMPRFDPTENMVIENPSNAIQPSYSSSLPRNQTMNLENNLNPTPFFIPVLGPNQELVRPVEMHQFNPNGNMVFENQWIATSSLSPSTTENLDFHKTNTDIICENYLRVYRVDSSSARHVVDRNGAAAFNDTNALFFSSGNEMQYFPAASSPSTEFPPPCNEVKAATHGEAHSSAFKSKWSVEEHMLFLVGMEIYGRGDWTNIADKVVITKTNTQVSSHAQKYFLRLKLTRKTKGKKRTSIHDITIVDPELLSKVRARLGQPRSLPVNK